MQGPKSKSHIKSKLFNKMVKRNLLLDKARYLLIMMQFLLSVKKCVYNNSVSIK